LDQSKEEYYNLIHENPDNIHYFYGLEQVNGLSLESRSKLLEMYDEMQKKYPHSNVALRLPLKYAIGSTFESLIDSYLMKMFKKGVPSLFSSFKDLLDDSQKTAAIQKIVEGYNKSLIANETFKAADSGEF
jgi:peptide alpha-N-acetyltransferase